MKASTEKENVMCFADSLPVASGKIPRNPMAQEKNNYILSR